MSDQINRTYIMIWIIFSVWVTAFK